MNERFGKFVAELRKEKGVTQQELCENCFVKRETVSKWERGVNIPEPETLVLLSDYFNISINELLAGGRKNDENKKQVENVALDVLTDARKNMIKFKRRVFIVFFGSFVLFLLYYFISNYNSLRVYVVQGDNEVFGMSRGIIVTSKQKSYISLGNIINRTNNEIVNLKLYFEYKNEKRLLLETETITDLNIDLNSYNEFIKTKAIDEVLYNLYLYIEMRNQTVRLPLNVRLDFANTFIFPWKVINEKSNNMSSKLQSNSIMKKFRLIESEYVYSYTYKKVKYNCVYDGVRNIVISDSLGNEYVYEIDSKYFRLYSNGIIFNYSYDNHLCIDGLCSLYEDVINSFERQVLA